MGLFLSSVGLGDRSNSGDKCSGLTDPTAKCLLGFWAIERLIPMVLSPLIPDILNIPPFLPIICV